MHSVALDAYHWSRAQLTKCEPYKKNVTFVKCPAQIASRSPNLQAITACHRALMLIAGLHGWLVVFVQVRCRSNRLSCRGNLV